MCSDNIPVICSVLGSRHRSADQQRVDCVFVSSYMLADCLDSSEGAFDCLPLDVIVCHQNGGDLGYFQVLVLFKL